MDVGVFITFGGYVAAVVLFYMHQNVTKKLARTKGVIDGLNKELDLAKDRIADLMRASTDGVRVDEAGRIRDG